MHKQRGFTLLEISIALLIIAFLMGGVVVGQSMIKSARLREVMGDYDRYIKAIKEFQDKYYALPGDMPNATSIWDTDVRAGGCPTTDASTVLEVKTCNGNGDGKIGDSTPDGIIDTTYAYEWFRAWQHLSNAGFISGKYSGVKAAADSQSSAIGINIPQSPLKKQSGWTLYYFIYTEPTSDDYWFDSYGHLMLLGGDTGGMASAAVLTPVEAKMIDEKMDDGKPMIGKVRAPRYGFASGCTDDQSGAVQNDVTYFDTSNIKCPLYFIGGF